MKSLKSQLDDLNVFIKQIETYQTVSKITELFLEAIDRENAQYKDVVAFVGKETSRDVVFELCNDVFLRTGSPGNIAKEAKRLAEHVCAEVEIQIDDRLRKELKLKMLKKVEQYDKIRSDKRTGNGPSKNTIRVKRRR